MLTSFTDEQLQSFLVLSIKHPALENPNNSGRPPQVLLELLAHVQVSLEATYISAVPTIAEAPRTSRVLGTGSMTRTSGRINPHPSILPPSTPNPVPSTTDQDRKYMTSEGTMLVANIWGSNTAEDSPEHFSLLWSEQQQAWLAIYCMAMTVCVCIFLSSVPFVNQSPYASAYIRLTFNDPLLCLTVSATLREKLISTTPKHPLGRFFASIGGNTEILSEESQESADETIVEPETNLLDGLQEANLLNGLLGGYLTHPLIP